MIDISIIILNYNTKKLLQNLLTSIFASDLNGLKIEVIVVDNASEDNSSRMVKDKYPQVKVIVNKENLGFSKGNNVGVKKAKGKYLLFLNSDTRLESDTLKKMFKFLENKKEASAATCYLSLANGKIDPACHRGFPTPWAALTYFSGLEKLFPKSKAFSQYHQTWRGLNKVYPIPVISGAFFMIKKDVFNSIGGFDEDYFMYGEDIDLCYRLNEKGHKIYFYPHTKAIHLKRQSGRQKKLSKINIQKELIIKKKTSNYFFDTMKLFYNKHYLKKYPKWLRRPILLGIFLMSRVKK